MDWLIKQQKYCKLDLYNNPMIEIFFNSDALKLFYYIALDKNINEYNN